MGIILCAANDASMVRYSVLNGIEKLFATRYKLELPTEKELRMEDLVGQRLLEEQPAGQSPKKKKVTQSKDSGRSRATNKP